MNQVRESCLCSLLALALAGSCLAANTNPLATTSPAAENKPAATTAPAGGIAVDTVLDASQLIDESKLPPQQAVAIRPVFCNHVPVSAQAGLARKAEKGWLFGVSEPTRRYTWYIPISDIDAKAYPILYITYRAKNVDTTPNPHLLYLESDANPLYVLKPSQVINDGRIHQLRMDLRKMDSSGKLSKLTLLGAGLNCDAVGPAEFELLGLRLEAAPDSAPSQARQQVSCTIVVKDNTGKPVEGADVTVDADRINSRRTMKTDKQGQATLTGDAEMRHLITVSHPGYATMKVLNVLDEIQKEAVLIKARTYSGTVEDEAGKPVQGAYVRVWASAVSGQYSTIADEVVVTDAAGKWQTTILAESPNVRARASHADYQTSRVEYQYEKESTSEPADPASQFKVMKLAKALRLKGFVMDQQGRPVANATISSSAMYRPIQTFTAGHDGSFSIPVVASEPVTLTAFSDSLAPAIVKVDVQPDSDLSNIQIPLPPGRKVTGKVVDCQGRPVQDVSVACVNYGEGFIRLKLETDSKGNFSWNAAPKESFELYFNKQGFQSLQQVVDASRSDCTVTLLKSLQVRGRVTDAETGKPISKFKVKSATDNTNYFSDDRQSQASHPDGQYSQEFGRKADLYFVRIEASGYESQISQPISGGEGEKIVDFKLKPGKPVSLVVVDSDGKPVQGADVCISSQADQYNSYGGSSTKPAGKTDSEGKFTGGASEQEFQVVVTHSCGYASLTQDDLIGSNQVKLRKWGKIHGRVMLGSKPWAGADLTIYVQSTIKVGGGSGVIQTESLTAKTDVNGAFAFDRVAPGPASISILREMKNGRGKNPVVSRSIEMEPGQSLEMNFGGEGRPVVGRISLPEELAKSPENGRKTATSPTTYSSYETENVYCGLIENAAPDLPIPEAELMNMEPKARNEWIQNFMKSPEGKEYTRKQKQARQFRVEVAADGTFRAEDIPAGKYTLQYQKYSQTGMGAMAIQRIVVPEMTGGRSDEPLDLGVIEAKKFDYRGTAPSDTSKASSAGATLAKDKPLPDLKELGLPEEACKAVAGKKGMICFWDHQQRPSRAILITLSQKVSPGQAIILVHASHVDADQMQQWLSKNKITFPSYQVSEEGAKKLQQWGVKQLPWFVMTDSNNIVRCTGNNPDSMAVPQSQPSAEKANAQ